jgi:hypothetical protein
MSPAFADTPTVTKLAGHSLSAEGRRVAAQIQRYFPDAPIMLLIAHCESTGLVHREPTGELRRNLEGGTARGVFQVLMRVHRDEFDRLGLNPNRDHDYFTFVRRLYDKYGTEPWDPSQHCWGEFEKHPTRLIS